MADASRHDDGHERLLREVVTGDRARDDDAVQLLVAYCPECAEALDELRELADLLDRDARAERDALHPPDGNARDDAPAPVGPRPAVPAGNEPRRVPWAVLAPLAAAAAALLVFATLRDRGGGASVDDPGIGLPLGVGIEALEPRGEVDAYGTFRWRADRPTDGWYTLRIWADRREPGKKPVITEADLTEPAWTPSAEELEQLPDRIEWQVRLHGGEGGSAGAEAWLSGS